jgi:hypothetical protein
VAHGLSNKLIFSYFFCPFISFLFLERKFVMDVRSCEPCCSGTRHNLANGSICLSTNPFSTLPMITRATWTHYLALFPSEMVNNFHYEAGSSRFIDSHMEIVGVKDPGYHGSSIMAQNYGYDRFPLVAND